MEIYLGVWKKYAVFTGRAGRKEFWTFTLINALVILLLVISASVLSAAISKTLGGLVMLVYLIYAIAAFVPGLAVTVRRLHDTGRSGWWFLLHFIPLIGSILLLIFLVQDGSSGDNRFGTDPKKAGKDASA